MIDALSARQRRCAALALLGLLLALLWICVLHPIAAHLSVRNEERRSELRALSRDRALVSQAPSIKQSLASTEQISRWARLYDAPKPEQATVQLESDLRSLLKSPNALTSMTAQPATVLGPLTRIAVKVTLSMPIDQWADALSNLQAHARLIQIDNVTVQAPDFQATDTNPTLSIQAEIAGFMLTPQAARS